MPIYVIQRGESGPVKVGYSDDVVQRLASLQTGHDERLVLRRVFDGEKHDERVLHAMFFRHRLHGEWFAPAQDILSGEVYLPDMDVSGKRKPKASSNGGEDLTPEVFAQWLRLAYPGRDAAKRIAAAINVERRTARAWLQAETLPRATEFMRLVRENEALLAMVNEMARRGR